MFYQAYVEYLMFDVSEQHSSQTEPCKSKLSCCGVNAETPAVASGSSL